MRSKDICDHIAELLIHMPTEVDPSAGIDSSILNDLQLAADTERQAYADQLRLVSDETGDDPLIDAIHAARARMYAAERDLRLLIALGREFVQPRPYRLESLAHAAGMSISGVRTAYEDEEIEEVAELTGLRPKSESTPAAARRVRRDVARKPRKRML